MRPCVYLLASKFCGTIYIGVTSGLLARLHQRRTGLGKGFAWRYGATRLVRYELFASMPEAIAREKQLKRWHRQWKISLIESDNPYWSDLSASLGFEPLPDRLRRNGC
jgi:putative endonuclease